MPKGSIPSQERNFGVWDNVTSGLKDVWNGLTNAFQSTVDVFKPPTPPKPDFYQVSPNDTSLSQVADANGVPLDQLVAANNGAKTLPPSGSYISLTGNNFPNTYQGNTSATNAANQYFNQQTQLAPVHDISGGNLTSPYEGRGDPAAQRLRIQARDIAVQLQNGVLPDSIPSAAIGFIRDSNGVNMTIQDFVNEGYVMNSAGVLVRGDAASSAMNANLNNTDYTQTQAYQRWKDTPFLKQMRYDPQRKKLVSIGQLLREGKLDLQGNWHSRGSKKFQNQNRRRRMQTTAPVQPSAPTSRAAPTTVLDIHLGSG